MKKSLVELKKLESECIEKRHNYHLALNAINKEIPIEEVDSVWLNFNSALEAYCSLMAENANYILKNKQKFPTLMEAETIEKKLIKENNQYKFLEFISDTGMKLYSSEKDEDTNDGLRLCEYAAKGGLLSASQFLSHHSDDCEYSNKVTEQKDLIIEYNELVNKKNHLNTDDFYQKLKMLANRNSMHALNEIEFRFIEITEENKQQAFNWFTELDEANYTHGTYSLAYMYSAGFVEDESGERVWLNPFDGSIIKSTKRKNIKEKDFLKKAIEQFVLRNERSMPMPNGHETFSIELNTSNAAWLENIEDQSALHLTALGQIYLYLSKIELGSTKKAYLETSFTYFYKAGKMPEQFELGQYYSALLSLDDSIHINDEEKILINEWMESWTNEKLHVDDTELDESSFSSIIINHIIFYANTFSLRKNKKELEIQNKKLQASQIELEAMMSMVAHEFRYPLDNIIFNTIHENQVKLYTEAAQTMLGLLNIFSIISTDANMLKDKIKQDSQGDRSLITVFSKNLDMILLHLLSVSGAEKIQQHYMAYAKRHDQCDENVSYKVWCEDYFELEQALQIEWEASYTQLLNQANSLEQRLAWLEEHFFKLDIIGFERTDIQFKEYGTTEIVLTILLCETLVNAFKYYSSTSKQSVVLEWVERDGYQILICSNPSLRSERSIIKGSHKGHVFLSTLARKTGSLFSKPIPQDHFVLEFGIPNELLISK